MGAAPFVSGLQIYVYGNGYDGKSWQELHMTELLLISKLPRKSLLERNAFLCFGTLHSCLRPYSTRFHVCALFFGCSGFGFWSSTCEPSALCCRKSGSEGTCVPW